MRAGNSQRWRLFTADLTGIAGHRLDDSRVLEAVLTRALLDTIGHAPWRWLRHRFHPQGVSIVGVGCRLRVAVHTWPELNKATIDLWSDHLGIADAAERCAVALGGRSAPRRASIVPAQLSSE